MPLGTLFTALLHAPIVMFLLLLMLILPPKPPSAHPIPSLYPDSNYFQSSRAGKGFNKRIILLFCSYLCCNHSYYFYPRPSYLSLFIYISIYLYIYLSIYLSIYLYICILSLTLSLFCLSSHLLSITSLYSNFLFCRPLNHFITIYSLTINYIYHSLSLSYHPPIHTLYFSSLPCDSKLGIKN